MLYLINMIIDNDFLNKSTKESVHSFFLGDPPQFSWIFYEATNKIAEHKAIISNNKVVEQFQMVGAITQGAPAVDIVMDVFNKFTIKHGIKVDRIFRIKANLLTRGVGEGYHLPHIDGDTPHKVFLYYVNDSDGDTFMFDKFFDPDKESVDNLCVTDRISPEMGKAVMFDGYQYHASSSPIKNDFRCVINIDFI